MTLKNSFSKLVRLNLRTNIWSMALAFIGFFFAFPVYGALYIANVNNRIMIGSYMDGIATSLYRRDVLGEGNFLVIIGIVIIAIIIAFNGFSYLFSKSKVDLFHGVPIKRELLFWTQFVAGIITFIVPYLIMLLLSMIVAGANQVLDVYGIVSALIMFAINLLGFLLIYTTTIIAIMITGSLSVALSGTAVFMIYGPLIEGLVSIYSSEFYKTYSSHTIYSWIGRISPIVAYTDSMKGLSSFYKVYDFDLKKIAILILAVIILLIFSIALYKIRPSEAAGKAIAFNKAMPVIEIMILIPMALYCGIGFETLGSHSVEIAYGWFIFGVAVALILGHAIIQTIYHFDFKSWYKNPLSLCVGSVATVIIASIFIFDIFGYDKYVPEDSKYVSAAISSYGMQSGIEYFDFDVEQNEYGGYNVWLNADDYRFEHMKITDKELMRSFINAAYEDTLAEYEWSKAQQINENENSNESYTFITVKYDMANGKKVYRDYYINLPNRIELYNKLYADEEYKKGVFSIFELEDDGIKDIGYASVFGIEKTAFSDEQMKQLVEAYKSDLMNQDAYSLRDEIPYGYIFRKVTLKEYYGYVSTYYADKGYIYPSFKKTTELLKEYGVNTDLLSCVDKIDNITIENYHYDEAYEGEPDSKKYNQRSDIEAILNGAVSYEFVGVEGYFHNTENLDVLVNYKEKPDGYTQSYSFTFEKGKAPEFVMEDVNYESGKSNTSNNYNEEMILD